MIAYYVVVCLAWQLVGCHLVCDEVHLEVSFEGVAQGVVDMVLKVVPCCY